MWFDFVQCIFNVGEFCNLSAGCLQVFISLVWCWISRHVSECHTDKDNNTKSTYQSGFVSDHKLAICYPDNYLWHLSFWNVQYFKSHFPVSAVCFCLCYFLFFSQFFFFFLFPKPPTDYLQHNYSDRSVSLLSFCPAPCHLSSSLRSYF